MVSVTIAVDGVLGCQLPSVLCSRLTNLLLGCCGVTELEAGEQADTADTPSAAATEAAVAEASSATQPEGGKRSSKSRLGAFFSRSKRSVAPVVIPTADWSLVFLPAYEIVNALPCSIAIHVDQPPRPTKLRRDASRKQDGARDLFFLPDQFYVRDSNGDPIIAAPDEADDGDWVPFHTGAVLPLQCMAACPSAR